MKQVVKTCQKSTHTRTHTKNVWENCHFPLSVKFVSNFLHSPLGWWQHDTQPQARSEKRFRDPMTWVLSWTKGARRTRESRRKFPVERERKKRKRNIIFCLGFRNKKKKEQLCSGNKTQKNLASGLEKSRVSKLFGKNSRTNGSSKRQTSCTNHLESRRHVFLLLFYFKICIHVWMIF